MKKPAKITRVHLPVNEQDEPLMLGIVSADPDYKLTLKLNKKLNISLKGVDPVRIIENDSKELIFSKFSDPKAAPDSIINLYSNRSGTKYLLKKLKNIDYIFLIHDPGNNFITGDLPLKLRGIDTVTAVFNIDQKTLNDKNLRHLI